jgi:hypothetical protein
VLVACHFTGFTGLRRGRWEAQTVVAPATVAGTSTAKVALPATATARSTMVREASSAARTVGSSLPYGCVAAAFDARLYGELVTAVSHWAFRPPHRHTSDPPAFAASFVCVLVRLSTHLAPGVTLEVTPGDWSVLAASNAVGGSSPLIARVTDLLAIDPMPQKPVPTTCRAISSELETRIPKVALNRLY